jgi:hypothetical protein
MIKILVLEDPVLTAVGYWRLWLPLKAMQRLYPNTFDFTYKRKELNFGDVQAFDAIIVARPGSRPDINEFLEKAKAWGVKIIVDIDDHLLGLPNFHDLFHEFKEGSEQHKRAVKTLEMADLFWFSTEKFLETYHNGGIVAKNAIPPEWLPKEPAPDQGLFAWRGRSIQVHDLIYAGQDWYKKNVAKAKQWLFLGWLPPLQHGENAMSVPYEADTQKYLEKVVQSRFNGVWKPMVQCEFNDHKSNIALIEAALSGGYCITNYAGKPGWETASPEIVEYSNAVELWKKSCQYIETNANLYTESNKRARSILALLSLLPTTSPDTGNTLPT